jgi:hypothetical protein
MDQFKSPIPQEHQPLTFRISDQQKNEKESPVCLPRWHRSHGPIVRDALLGRLCGHVMLTLPATQLGRPLFSAAEQSRWESWSL